MEVTATHGGVWDMENGQVQWTNVSVSSKPLGSRSRCSHHPSQREGMSSGFDQNRRQAQSSKQSKTAAPPVSMPQRPPGRDEHL